MEFLIIFKFGKEIKLERQNFQNPNRPQKCGNPDSGEEPSDRRDCPKADDDGCGRDRRRSITRRRSLVQIHDRVPL